MAALNFPDPAVTTTYDPGYGTTYTWNATYSTWVADTGGGGTTYGAKNGVGLDGTDFQVDMAPLAARTAV